MKLKHLAPFAVALVAVVFTQIAFSGSTADCRVIYGALGALLGFFVTGMWVWVGHQPVRGVHIDLFPEREPYGRFRAGTYQDYGYAAWLADRQDRAREMYLQGMGDDVPPSDYYGR